MEDFLLQEKKSIYYLQSNLFLKEKGIISAFSTRNNGVSKPPFSSLNLAYHTGDNNDDVRENRRRFFSVFDLSPSCTVSGNQVHGLRIHPLEESDLKNGCLDGVFLPDCDAMVSDIRGKTLTAYSADCYLVGMYEAERKVIALIHAGWRGVLGELIPKTLDFLVKNYNCNRKKILTIVNPGICYNCFEVGIEVAEAFLRENIKNAAFIKEHQQDKMLINLKGIIKQQMLAGGVAAENSTISPYCTCCMKDFFYSYRRDSGKTGRMIALLGLT